MNISKTPEEWLKSKLNQPKMTRKQAKEQIDKILKSDNYNK